MQFEVERNFPNIAVSFILFSLTQEVFDTANRDLSPVHELPTGGKREPLPTNTSDNVFFSPVRTLRPEKAQLPTAEGRGLSVAEEFDRIQPTAALKHVTVISS